MPLWAGILSWWILFWGTRFFVPDRLIGRGFVTRKILARLPPKKWWRRGYTAYNYRNFLWWIVTLLLQITIWPQLAGNLYYPVFWGVVIALMLDDYYFGDDDKWKKLWEGIKNTVKWKMELPQTQTERA